MALPVRERRGTKRVQSSAHNASMNVPLPLPRGVTRDRHCRPNVDLHNCSALQLYFESGTSVIVWNDGPRCVKPVEELKRVRDLRPGDNVICFDVCERLAEVEVYR